MTHMTPVFKNGTQGVADVATWRRGGDVAACRFDNR